MNQSSRAFALVLLLLLPAVAMASPEETDSRTAEAKLHFESGMAHYHLEEWDAAISEFEAGFRARPSPQFLFNIAQAYRLSHRPERALAFYQKFLRMEPNAENRPEVERLMAEMQSAISATPSQPPTTTAPEPKPKAAVAATIAPPPQAPPEHELVVTKSRNPVYKRGWFWGVIAGVVVAGVAATVLGVMLASSSSDKTLPLARF